MPLPRLLTASALLLALAAPARAADNELTPEEKKEGYVLLFDGTSLKGWHRTSAGFGGWAVKDGALCLSKGGGMLYADGKYDNFVLKIDFQVTMGCNSGVFVRTGNERDPVQTGIEVQIQDDAGKKPGRHSCGAIYDLVAPDKQLVKKAGEWNTFVLTCNKNVLTVELNGEKVSAIDLDKWDKPGMRPDGSKHKFKKALKDFPRSGLIGLQDHGKPVCFKNIKIKPLKAD